jgi:hypothetical protein
MKGNRDPYTKDEKLPLYEVVNMKHSGNPIQLRYNFQEVEMEDRVSWNYDYVDIVDLSRETLISAKVPQNIIDEILTY